MYLNLDNGSQSLHIKDKKLHKFISGTPFNLKINKQRLASYRRPFKVHVMLFSLRKYFQRATAIDKLL